MRNLPRPTLQYAEFTVGPDFLSQAACLDRFVRHVEAAGGVSFTHEGQSGELHPLKGSPSDRVRMTFAHDPFGPLGLISTGSRADGVQIGFKVLKGGKKEVVSADIVLQIWRPFAWSTILDVFRGGVTSSGAIGANLRSPSTWRRPLGRIPHPIVLFGVGGAVGLNGIEVLTYIDETTAQRYEFPIAPDLQFRAAYQRSSGGWMLSPIEFSDATPNEIALRNLDWLSTRFATPAYKPGERRI